MLNNCTTSTKLDAESVKKLRFSRRIFCIAFSNLDRTYPAGWRSARQISLLPVTDHACHDESKKNIIKAAGYSTSVFEIQGLGKFRSTKGSRKIFGLGLMVNEELYIYYIYHIL